MHEINRLLKAAAFRLFVIDAMRTLTVSVAIGLGVLLAVLGAHKLTAWEPDFGLAAAIALGASVVGGLVWAYARRPTGLALADEVDRRAGLRETLSTAVVIAPRATAAVCDEGDAESDGWSRSIVDSAAARAKGVRMSEAAPIESPRLWWVPSLLLFLIAGAVFAPRYDLTGVLAQREAEEAQERELTLVKAEIEAEQQKLEMLVKRAGLEPEAGQDELDLPEGSERDPLTPDDVRRQALSKLTSLRDQLAEQRRGEEGQTVDALRDELSKLTKPGPGPMSEFGRRLARGEFGAARSALDQAMKALESGSMSDEQKEQMKAQLERLAEQLEDAATMEDAVKQALAAAGIDPARASELMQNPEAMKQAIENAPNLSEQQKQSLQEACKACENAGGAMQGLASSLGMLAQSMSSQSGQQAADQLTQMEMMQAEMAAAEMAMAEVQSQMSSLGDSMCEGGACMNPGSGDGMNSGYSGVASGQGAGQGQWSPSEMTAMNQGSGGAGRGSGGAGPEGLATDFNLTSEKAVVNDRGGPIIGETTIFGKQLIGESRKEYGATVAAAAARAEDAVESMRVPRELRESVRAYFGSVQEVTGEPAAERSTESPAE